MTQQICTFYLNGSYFGIEIEDVQEIIRQPSLTRIPLAPPEICGLINLRGQIIPVVDLACRLALRATSCAIDVETAYNIIVHTIEDTVSFIVDDIGDVLHCSSTAFEPPPSNLHPQMRAFLKGTYKLDQDFLLVLNTAKILD
jgi:purine-binding chemotaxis protein CheW